MIRYLWRYPFLIAALLSVAFAVIQILGCSSPLTTEDINGPQPGGTDTVVIIIADTFFVMDTLYIPGDTIIIPGDTIFVPVDTIYLPGDTLLVPVDTVYLPGDTIYMPPDTVIEHDTLLQYCGRLESPVQEIQWLLMNDSGQYVLEFQAALENDRPEQALIVDIDGLEFEWYLADTLHFRFEGPLGQEAIVRICLTPPPARGHGIDICMVVRRI